VDGKTIKSEESIDESKKEQEAKKEEETPISRM
jgi:hypothetical protein